MSAMLFALIFPRAQRASTYDISAERNLWLQSALRSSAIIRKHFSLRSSAIVCDYMETSLKRQRTTNYFPSTPRQQQLLSFSLPPTPSSFTPGFCSVSHKPLLSPQRFKMSAFLYTFERELITLNVGDFQFQNGLKFKKVAAKFCRVSLNE